MDAHISDALAHLRLVQAADPATACVLRAGGAALHLQSDNDINNRLVSVLEEGGKETEVAWKDLSVGDIVKVVGVCV